MSADMAVMENTAYSPAPGMLADAAVKAQIAAMKSDIQARKRAALEAWNNSAPDIAAPRSRTQNGGAVHGGTGEGGRMVDAAKTEFTQEQKEAFFSEIIRLYDLADDVVNAVGAKEVTNKSQQMELVVPFLKCANASIDSVASIYTDVIRDKQLLTEEKRKKLEVAFQDFFIALRDFVEKTETWVKH